MEVAKANGFLCKVYITKRNIGKWVNNDDSLSIAQTATIVIPK